MQRRARSLLEINSWRIGLIDRYLEFISVALYTHIGIILSDRGLDLNNMNYIDSNKLNALSTAYPNITSMLFRMETVSFHLFLREHNSQLKILQKNYNHTQGRYIIDQSVKRKILLSFLYKKKRENRHTSTTKNKFHFKIPVFSVVDARGFLGIDNEDDPLTNCLKRISIEEEEWRKQIKESNKTSSSPRKHRTPAENNIFLVITSLTAVDCTSVIISMVLESVAKRKIHNTNKPKNSADPKEYHADETNEQNDHSPMKDHRNETAKEQQELLQSPTIPKNHKPSISQSSPRQKRILT
jgi:hypothetical protein